MPRQLAHPAAPASPEIFSRLVLDDSPPIATKRIPWRSRYAKLGVQATVSGRFPSVDPRREIRYNGDHSLQADSSQTRRAVPPLIRPDAQEYAQGEADNNEVCRTHPSPYVFLLVEDTLMFGGTLLVPSWLETELEPLSNSRRPVSGRNSSPPRHAMKTRTRTRRDEEDEERRSGRR